MMERLKRIAGLSIAAIAIGLLYACSGGGSSSGGGGGGGLSEKDFLGSWAGTIDGQFNTGHKFEGHVTVNVKLTVKYDERYALPFRGTYSWRHPGCSHSGTWAGTAGGRTLNIIVGGSISGTAKLENRDKMTANSIAVWQAQAKCGSDQPIAGKMVLNRTGG